MKSEYDQERGRLGQFRERLLTEVAALLDDKKIYLATPIEARVKTWESIAEKIERRSLVLKNINDVTDLVGLRIMLVFSRDVSTVCNLVENTFAVLERQDHMPGSDPDRFGYASIHYHLSFPDEWKGVPALAPFVGLRFELQIRTLAQHMWAAASHALQYKNEQSVPRALLRRVYRVSALLEMIDDEFGRLIVSKEQYRSEVAETQLDRDLDVDVLEHLLDQAFPSKNKSSNEDFAELIVNLRDLGVQTTNQLSDILREYTEAALQRDADAVRVIRDKRENTGFEVDDWSRIDAGVFYNYTGLLRAALRAKFGDANVSAIVNKWIAPKLDKKKS